MASSFAALDASSADACVARVARALVLKGVDAGTGRGGATRSPRGRKGASRRSTRSSSGTEALRRPRGFGSVASSLSLSSSASSQSEPPAAILAACARMAFLRDIDRLVGGSFVRRASRSRPVRRDAMRRRRVRMNDLKAFGRSARRALQLKNYYCTVAIKSSTYGGGFGGAVSS